MSCMYLFVWVLHVELYQFYNFYYGQTPIFCFANFLCFQLNALVSE